MFTYFYRQKEHALFSATSRVVVCVLSLSLMFAPSAVYAQSSNFLNLPTPGTMVFTSPAFNPAIVTGIKIYPDNPLQFDFIIDIGDDQLQGEALRQESQKLINYFMATLTVPEDEMWVNLSPYEKDRIIAEGLSHTEMGRDMLAQDYLLKQLTASLMYPEDDFGKEFWNRVYTKAQDKYGTTEIPVNTFNKIWIVPDEAVVYVHDTNVFVVENHLKVMLEEDYLALESNVGSTKHGLGSITKDDIEVVSGVSAEIIREVLLPEIEREVNEGKNFANLRQMYNSMLLATWYKKNLKESLLGKIYIDKNRVNGIEIDDKEIKQKVYDQYVEAFEKGVYNYIKEDIDSATKEVIPRKYFSGGLSDYSSTPVTETGTVSSPIADELGKGEYAIARVNGKMLGDETVSSPIFTKKMHPEEIFTDQTPEGLSALSTFVEHEVYSVKAVRGVMISERVVREMVSDADATSNEMMFHLAGEGERNVIPLDKNTGVVTYHKILAKSEGERTISRDKREGHPAHSHPFGDIHNNSRLMSTLDAEMISHPIRGVRRDQVGIIMGGSKGQWGFSAWIWSEHRADQTSNLNDPDFMSLPITVVDDQGRPLSSSRLRKIGIMQIVNPKPYVGADEELEDVSDIMNLRVWLGQVNNYLKDLKPPEDAGRLRFRPVRRDPQELLERGMQLWTTSRFNESEETGSSPVQSDNLGGIDFNPNNINLSEQGDKIQINFTATDIQNLNLESINGILPVIINISPLPSVLPLLGLSPQKEEEFKVSSLN